MTLQFFQSPKSTFPKCEARPCLYHAVKGTKYCQKHADCQMIGVSKWKRPIKGE